MNKIPDNFLKLQENIQKQFSEKLESYLDGDDCYIRFSCFECDLVITPNIYRLFGEPGYFFGNINYDILFVLNTMIERVIVRIMQNLNELYYNKEITDEKLVKILNQNFYKDISSELFPQQYSGPIAK